MVELAITGMTCGGCAANVQQALEAVPGVQTAEVSYEDAYARVETSQEVPAAELTEAVKAVGYEATLASEENQRP
jgi:copper chaperone CopZ